MSKPTRLTGALLKGWLNYPEDLAAAQRPATATDHKQVSERVSWVRTFTAAADGYRPVTVYACRRRCDGNLLRLPRTQCHHAAGAPTAKICRVGFFLGGPVYYLRLPSARAKSELLVLVEHPTKDVAVSAATRRYYRGFDYRLRLGTIARELGVGRSAR